MKPLGKKGTARRNEMIKIGVEEAEKRGYKNVNRAHICERLGVCASLVNRHIGDLDALREAIIREAVAMESIPVIAQLALDKHPYVAGAVSQATQQKVIAHLFG